MERPRRIDRGTAVSILVHSQFICLQVEERQPRDPGAATSRGGRRPNRDGILHGLPLYGAGRILERNSDATNPGAQLRIAHASRGANRETG